MGRRLSFSTSFVSWEITTNGMLKSIAMRFMIAADGRQLLVAVIGQRLVGVEQLDVIHDCHAHAAVTFGDAAQHSPHHRRGEAGLIAHNQVFGLQGWSCCVILAPSLPP